MDSDFVNSVLSGGDTGPNGDFVQRALSDYDEQQGTAGAELPSSATATPTPTPHWDAPTEGASAYFGGFGPEINAGVRALGIGVGKDERDATLKGSLGDRYDQALAQEKDAQSAWVKANGPKTTAAHLVGGALGAGTALAIGGGVLGAGAKLLPEAAAPVVSFLSGEGGLASRAAQGAVANVGAGAYLHNVEPNQDWGTNAGYDAATGMLLGPMAHYVSPYLEAGAARGAKAFTDLVPGLSLRLGNLGGEGAPSGLGAITRTTPEDIGKVNSALANEATGGELNAPHYTRAELDDAKDAIGQKMEGIVSNYKIPLASGAHMNLMDSLNDIDKTITNAVSDPDRARNLRSLMDNIKSKVSSDDLTGQMYQDLTGKRSDLSRYAKSGDYIATDIKNALVKAWGESLPPEALAKWQPLNNQYRMTNVLQRATDDTKGGPDPRKLVSEINSARGYGGLSRAGNFGTMARGYNQYLRPYVKPSASPMATIAESGLGAAGGLLAAGSAAGELHHIPLVGPYLEEHPTLTGLASAGMMLRAGGRRALNSPMVMNALTRAGGGALPLGNAFYSSANILQPGYGRLTGQGQQ